MDDARSQPQGSGPVPGDVRAHGRRDADARVIDPRRARVRGGPGRRRHRLRRGAVRTGAASGAGHDVGRRGRGGAGRVPAGERGTTDQGPDAAHRDADGGAEPGDRRSRRALARPGRLRVRHRRRGGGLPPHATPRRVRAHPRGELPPDDPRGRGVRTPLDLGGPAALRRGTPRPRGPHRRRHRGRARRLGPPGTARGDGARPSRSLGAVSDVQRAFRRGGVASRSIPSGCSPISGSASRSTRTTG